MLKHTQKMGLFIITLCGLNILSHASPQQIKPSPQLDHAWLTTALKMQREIDLDAPLKEATFIGTHNSYNSQSYQDILGTYVDPNQIFSLYDQLELGIRSVELDVHWTWSDNFQKDILLCHGKPNHLGCSPFDRRIWRGLEELRKWLNANPGEIVLLYIERHLDGHESKLAAQLEKHLGNFIFKPEYVRNNKDDHSCLTIPTKLSKADILRAGKQLLIVTKGCDNAKHGPYLNNYVFSGPGDQFSFIDFKVKDFKPYPDCNKSDILASDYDHTSLWRVYEDRTILTNIIKPEKPISANDIKELLRCGINWPAVDMLHITDSRIYAAIWSWAPSYPKGEGQCAVYKYDEGIQNAPCNNQVTGLICQEERTHSFKAIAYKSPWKNGESICQSIAGHDWHFAMPVNGQQLDLVKVSMAEQGLQQVWLNYAIDKQGSWKANLKM